MRHTQLERALRRRKDGNVSRRRRGRVLRLDPPRSLAPSASESMEAASTSGGVVTSTRTPRACVPPASLSRRGVGQADVALGPNRLASESARRRRRSAATTRSLIDSSTMCDDIQRRCKARTATARTVGRMGRPRSMREKCGRTEMSVSYLATRVTWRFHLHTTQQLNGTGTGRQLARSAARDASVYIVRTHSIMLAMCTV